MRKTARKTTSNAVSQTTIDEFILKDNADDDNTKSKRLKDDKHAFTSASIDNEKPAPLPRTWAEFEINPEQYRHHPTWDLLSPAEFYETVQDHSTSDDFASRRLFAATTSYNTPYSALTR